MNWTAGLALSAALLAGCQTCPPAPAPEVVTKTRVVDTACDWTRPIYLDKSDVLSDATAKAILAHNQAGAKACNWKPLR
ncbi:hypothetical protein [Cupriavidus alkaliphilus]|uniref:hypothetical protein n=1 Tax=Cupriavidus alkaliphilus TaxID=942866 RepID=UPI000DC54DB1|nr:hypothetical protein [Cupriavidus alkaliphilus]MBB3011614.1 hypothetical protein [Cupriavidus alkaliphilus]RAS11263.1 hypothetical protein C7415_102387 [Cupriavidus alkaliphilus]